MSDERNETPENAPDDDVDAHLLKESLAAGAATAAIFAGSAQAGAISNPAARR